MTRILHTWQEQADPAHTALVMVDLQNDFVDPDGWVARQQVPGFLGDTGIAAVADRARELLRLARAADVLRVFVRMIGDDQYLSGPMQALYARNHGHQRPTCVQEGTWGADWPEGLGPDGSPRELVVDKHRYSAFIGTRLDQLLRSHDISTIVVCGVATTGCVESTIRDGLMLDRYVVIAGDACGDYEQHRHDASLSKLALSFATVVSVADLATHWTGAAAPEVGPPDDRASRPAATAPEAPGTLYGDGARALQDEFDARRLADRLASITVHDELNDGDLELIRDQAAVWLATVDADGWPDVSYKGGLPGFIEIVDPATLRIPIFNGNGMWRTLGNIRDTGRVALLFVDQTRPWRMRVHGTATVRTDDVATSAFTEAEAVVEVRVGRVFPNCGRYIHATDGTISPYVPRPGVETPIPDWKRLPVLNEVLPEEDPARRT